MDFLMQHNVWMLMEMLAYVRGAAAAFNFLLLLSSCVSGANSVKIVVHEGICLCSLIQTFSDFQSVLSHVSSS